MSKSADLRVALFIPAFLVAWVIAGAAIAQGGEQDYAYVSKVQVNEDNYGYINVKGNFGALHGCPQTTFARTQFDLSDKRAEIQLRIAATSFVSGSPVHVWTAGCTSDGYPMITRIQLQETYVPSSCPAGQHRCGNVCVPTGQRCPCTPPATRKCPGDDRCYGPKQSCP